MGNKVSAIHGVKSADFYNQGNAINEIWVGDVELVSRLPFGDSDLGQAGWPEGSWPKIPWHQFIIPLKRSIDMNNDTITATNETVCKSTSTLADMWPDRGFFSDYKYVCEEFAYILGLALMALGFGLAMTTSWQREVMKRDLELFPRVRVYGPSPAPLASVIKSRYRFWTLLTLARWVLGIILSFLSLPFLLFWSAGNLTLFAVIIMTTLALLSFSGGTTLYTLGWLFILRRRGLKAHQQASSVDEKPAEAELPPVTMTLQQYEDFV